MAMNTYGTDGAKLTVFGIPLDEFGETDPPITIEGLEDRSTLKRGLGGTSVRLDNKTRPVKLTVNLMPGSEQARQIIAAAKSGIDATFTFYQSGTAEYFAGFDGVLTKRGNVERGGKTKVSDEQFVFEFSDSEET
ncbi:hypothetical protein PO654_03280 [Phytobacter diazotrophicus]|jgi:hypothetical protein|uniref:Phage tail protein n=2 Tax=Enterobacteriaceae TaxID=543 RepID=A0ABW1Q3G4_9ENTR|nr:MULTISPECIES: hypothetical protein [Phytobacter]MBS6739354.1 hypothetical protein [Enterobacteriaceae bacterium]PXW60660.1 hypothetical protein DFO55_10270 [Grimontella sp. AG753]QIH64214.1 hypothetical protein CRX67_14600 [Enterobacteriaceae bacterium A-F18]MDU4152731.1 hypothetical protein [Enterobacteriaceae bacterium]MDU4353028.1 hypothetical protein [Phytobacter diazotrophicus]